ncbi:hypothetical protein D3C79_996020 [compost metagenome]
MKAGRFVTRNGHLTLHRFKVARFDIGMLALDLGMHGVEGRTDQTGKPAEGEGHEIDWHQVPPLDLVSHLLGVCLLLG